MANVQKREYSWVLILEAGIGAYGRRRRIKRTRTIQADGYEEACKKLAEFQTEFEASLPYARIGTKTLFRIDT